MKTSKQELDAYHDSLVRRGLEEMRNGRLIPHAEVVKRLQEKIHKRRKKQQG